MQYVKFHYSVPFAGCDTNEYIAFRTPRTEEELMEWAEEGAQSNAEGYEWMATGWEADPEDPDYEEAVESYWEDVSGYYELISKEEWEDNEGTIED